MASDNLWKCGVCKDVFYDLDTFVEHECSNSMESDIEVEHECSNSMESDIDVPQPKISENNISETEELVDGNDEPCNENADTLFTEENNAKESQHMECDIFSGQKQDEVNCFNNSPSPPPTTAKTLKEGFSWLYVAPVCTQNFVCSVCDKIISYNETSELITHLDIHGLDRLEVIQNNQTYILKRDHPLYTEVEETKSDETKNEEAKNEETKSDETKSIAVNHSPHLSWDHLIAVNNSGNEIILDKIITFLVSDLLPASFIQGEGFHNFLKDFDSQFEIPSVTVMKKLILQKYTSELVQVQLDISNSHTVHLSLEFWLKERNKKFITITLHMITKDFDAKRYTLKTLCFQDQFDSFLINTTLQLFILEWNLGAKVECILTSRNRPLMETVDAAKKTNIICLAHTLNEIVRDLFYSSTELNQLLKKCYSFIFILNLSTTTKEKLLRLSETNKEAKNFLEYLESEISPTYPHKLEKDCNSYWILKFYVLYQINVLRKISFENDDILADFSSFDANDWVILEEAVQVFKMCEVVIGELCSEQFLPLSKVIPILHGLWSLTDNCDVNTECAKKLYKSLLSQLQKNFGTIENDITMAIATILDPRFKHVVFQSEDAVRVAVRHIVTRSRKFDAVSKTIVNTSTVNTSTLSYVEHFLKEIEEETNTKRETSLSDCIIIQELKNYFDEPLINSDTNPFMWWKENGSVHYPLLAEVAKSIMSIPSSSVPPVRIFMKKEKLFFKRRKNIKTKYIDQMLFLNQLIK